MPILPSIADLRHLPAAEFDWQTAMPRMCREIGHAEPLYWLARSELPGTIRPFGPSAGEAVPWATPFEVWLRSRGRWDGDGWAVIVNADAHVSGYDLLMTALHELGHAVDPSNVSKSVTGPDPATFGILLVATTPLSGSKPPQPSASGFRHHGAAWARAVWHVAWRIAQLCDHTFPAWSLVEEIAAYSLTPPAVHDMLMTLSGEPRALAGLPLREAIAQPPPAAFAALSNP